MAKVETNQSGFKSGLVNQLTLKVAVDDSSMFSAAGGLISLAVDLGVGAGIGILIQKGYNKSHKEKPLPGAHLIDRIKGKKAKKATSSADGSETKSN